jgi:hypothetical protein
MENRRKVIAASHAHRTRLACALITPTSSSVVQLQPKRQPGRVDRKAAAFVVEISQLRSAGYTYEAIREAVADAGIEVSTSALRREVRRLRSASSAISSHSASTVPLGEVNAIGCPAPDRPSSHHRNRSRDLAEAFFNANPSNSLISPKEFP